MAADVTYLGDAVYLRREESGDLTLFTSNGLMTTNRIVLEPEVLLAFLAVLPRFAPEVLRTAARTLESFQRKED